MSRRSAVSSRFLKLRYIVLPFRFCFTVFFITQVTRRCTSLSPVSHIRVPLNVFGLFVSITSTNAMGCCFSESRLAPSPYLSSQKCHTV